MGKALSPAQVQTAVRILRAAFPETEGIYVFGSAASGELDVTGGHSDIDIALLLPHGEAKAAGSLALSEARFQLEEALGRTIDLVNVRTVSIVLQKEIIGNGICVFAKGPGSDPAVRNARAFPVWKTERGAPGDTRRILRQRQGVPGMNDVID